MNGGVEFEENQNFDPIPQPVLKPPSVVDSFLKSGVISNPGDAAVLLGVFALLLIGVSFYVLISSVPPPPNLGSDVLRQGEQVPDYIGN